MIAHPWTRRLLALAAGAALPLAFAPFGWYPVAIVSVGILFFLWHAPPREAAWRGFCYGVGAFTAGTWWLYISVRLVGGTPLPVAFLLLGGLVAIMAGWIALAGWVSARLAPASAFLHCCALMPAAWILAEWCRGWVLTGFPWLSIGYGQIDGPLAAWAPLGGVYAVSLVAALAAGALTALVAASGRQRLAPAAVLIGLVVATGALQGIAWTAPSGEPLRVALVQGAVPQLLKWEPSERRATMALYAAMTAALPPADLIVWPEAAIPAPDSLVPEYLDELRAFAAARDTQLLVGILTHDEQTDEYRNSLLALGAPAGVYHKRHLVPFGEYFPVPPFVRNWMRMMNLPYSDLTPGDDEQALLSVRGVGLAPTICYEDAYGTEQRVFAARSGLLVTVSNDAWFGDTIAPHQHLEIARMRALETGRPLVRSTNTGITAVTDEFGRLVATAPAFRPEVLNAVVQPFGGQTPYVRAGNWPVLLLALACGFGAALWRRRA